MVNKNTDKLLKEYISKRELYRDFSQTVKSILEELLADFKFQVITAREKVPAKLHEKILRKAKEKGVAYKSLDEIEDLAGVRVVFYLESQKRLFLELLRKEINENNLFFEERYKAGGYRATHCIFSLDASRSILPEYRKYKDLKCEIQITSALYHAWSEIEHDIIYKPGEDKKALNELGLKKLKKSFEETMINHIQVASHQFENLYIKYRAMVEGANIFKEVYNIQNILASSTNDDIYGKLEIIENFPNRKSEEIITIIKSVLSKKSKKAVPIGSFGGEKIFGKSHKEIVIKCISLIKDVRYFSTEKVLLILIDLIKSKDKEIKEKSIDALRAVARFDYHLMTKSNAGYSYQKFVLDFLNKWTLNEKLSNMDFVITVVKELISSSIEGSSWTDEKTLMMNFTQVDPTDFLKKIRKETMDFVYELYTKTSDAKIRLRLASILEEVMRGPSNVAYSDSLRDMIEDDTKYLVNIYRKMIFNKKGKLIKENIAVAEDVEDRFYYFAKPEKGRTSELSNIREDILKDAFYRKVCPMIGGRAVYKNEVGYEESRILRVNDMKSLIEEISEKNLEQWKKYLDTLARQKNVIEEWKLADFKRFLEMLSLEKPEIADRLLSESLKGKEGLICFSENFLIGFQVAKRFDLWDKYSVLIAKKRDAGLVGGICNSLLGYTAEQSPRILRANELAILEEIVFKKGRFAFLKLKKKDNEMWYLHDRIFHALAFNFKPQPRKMERFIKEEIENNPEYAQVHYNGLQVIVTVWKWIDLSLASCVFKKYLRKKVIEAPDLDWHLQEFLIEICKKDFNCIIDIFKKRIARAIAIQKMDTSRGIKRLTKRKEFEAIPYHFNPDLQNIILNNEGFSKKMHEWIGLMTLGWSSYNWEISRFLESLKIDRKKVFSEVVENGSDNDLLRVINAMDGVSGTDLEFCLKIVGQTDNKKIHRMIGSIMYSIGMASGEYGIADAYKDRILELDKYKNSENKRISKFAKDMIVSFQKSEDEERKRVAEEIQIRKSDFRG
ncbi:MAG: RelA/SpoT domain-containing protein [Candidatus Moranbacteria bacterium]|nr:RelA/SpoT domain-containing protein [Candidatus Moranbacteria bacterium]